MAVYYFLNHLFAVTPTTAFGIFDKDMPQKRGSPVVIKVHPFDVTDAVRARTLERLQHEVQRLLMCFILPNIAWALPLKPISQLNSRLFPGFSL
jgi:hypothetical protein